MNKKLNLLALLAAGAVTVLVVAGVSSGASKAAPSNSAVPTISGTTQEGNTLTATSGTWSGTTPITYTYQWRRCNANGGACGNINGATGSTYGLKAADVNHTIRVRVTAKNSDGTADATSDNTAKITKAAAPPTTVNGCPSSGSGTLDIAQITSPAHLLIDGQTASPSTITRSIGDLTLRFHVSACNGRPVQNALVLAQAIPFEQFATPAEVSTDGSGWATITLHRARFFPASPRQQVLAVFVRARKTGEPLLAGIAARRMVSFPVHL
jgi:hypothetical protein